MVSLKILIIPDIHGRTFWKEAKDFDGTIVFLGDYLDPYTHYEDITKKEALENFKEILEFAKSNPNVILLTGNHDMTYFISSDICECRTDYDNFYEIKNLFRDNAKLFKLAYSFEHEGENFLLTHAGVHKNWLKDCGIESENPIVIADILNEKFNDIIANNYNRMHEFIKRLSDVSYYRGGWDSYGSCVWADIHEYEKLEVFSNTVEHYDFYQIIGHTRLEKGCPYIGKYIACIDAREAYTIDEIIKRRNNIVKVNENK